MATVKLQVPLVGQKVGKKGSMACWYASACMVAYYREAGPRLGLPATWVADAGLSMGQIVDLAKVEGLIAVNPVPAKLTSDTVATLLKHSGPIWSAGYFLDGYPTAGHVVVLTGIDGPLVHYNDPWEPRAKKRAVEWFDKNLLRELGTPMLYRK